MYKLFSICVHAGSGSDNGTPSFYHVIMSPKMDSNWFRFNNDHVIPITEDEALEEGFGSDDLDEKVADEVITRERRRYYNSKEWKRFTSATMLLYIREDDIKSLLNCDSDSLVKQGRSVQYGEWRP